MTTEQHYLAQAFAAARNLSGDPRTQNGAVLVTPAGESIVGANSVPVGIAATPARLSTVGKYQFIEHAERRVIYAAARAGTATSGSTLYCVWFACPDCARAIIEAGICAVVGHVLPRSRTPDRWVEAVVAGEAMLREANVAVRWLAHKVGATITFDGEPLEC